MAGVDDWIEARLTQGSAVDAALPRAVRNSASFWSVLLRLRPEAMAAADATLDESLLENLVDIAEFPETQETPMRGDLTKWQSYRFRNRWRELGRKRVRAYLGNRYTVGWPNSYDVEALDSMAETAAAADVELVFAELPLAPALVREIPPEVIDEFRRIVTRVAKRHGLEFLTLSRLDTKFTRKHFREHSHVNNRGAIKFSKAVAKKLRKRLLALN